MVHAKRRGREGYGDDFASYVLEVIIKQGYLKYNLKWLWSSFLRDTVGNIANIKGRAKSEANFNPIEVEKAFGVSDTSVIPPDESLAFADIIDRYEGNERIILVLRFKWDFSEAEIAQVLGLSHQRVHQISSKLYRNMELRKVVSLGPPKG